MRISDWSSDVCSSDLDEAALVVDGIFAAVDYRTVHPAAVAFQAPAEGFAGHRQAIEMEQRLQLAQDRPEATRRMKMFHVEAARRLQIDEHRQNGRTAGRERVGKDG